MNILKITFPFFLILIFISACQKDKLEMPEPGITEPEIPPVVNTIQFEIEVTGEVFDAFNEPISGAVVNLGETIAMTDDNGYFQITGLANEQKAILSIEKNNYFTGYPVFYPEEGVGQHVRVEMMNRDIAGSFNVIDNMSKVVAYNSHQIDFNNATFENTNGTAYSGDVNVFVNYLDPTSEDLQQFMPGDLVGINTESEEQFLKSFGMLNVELEDNAGNLLTMIGEATMTMEIPNTLLSTAPSTIPLWYFDTESGNWIEEGEAVLEGTQYVGTVTHFTLWNCDAPFDLVTINGTVNSMLEATSFNLQVIRPNNDYQTASLNENLRFEGKVPSNEVLTLQIIDLCGAVVYEETIGPLSVDTNVGTLDVDPTTLSSITIAGNAVNCDAQPITDGYAIIFDDDGNSHFATFDNDGNFAADLAWCTNNQVNITAFDSATNKISETTTFDYNQTINAALVACEDEINGIYIEGPEVNLFIPAIGGIEHNSDPNLPVSTMIAVDDQGNGNSVLYEITIVSWTNDPANPQLLVTYVTTLVGNPSPIYTWDVDVTPLYEIYSNEPGGIIDVKAQGAILSDDGAGTVSTFGNHTVRIVGVIE